jgi:hypothetical protein
MHVTVKKKVKCPERNESMLDQPAASHIYIHSIHETENLIKKLMVYI